MADKSSDWQPGPNVCRCCFAEGCYKDISTEYFWMGKKEVYSDMLLDTFDISIGYSKTQGPNSNSRLICEPCISRLRDATDFKRQVQECERTFMQHLDPGRSSTVEVPLEQHKGEIKLERVKIEEEKSDDDFDAPFDEPFGDDDDDDLDDQPLTKLATKIPKKESEDLLRNLLVKAEKRKAPLKVKVVPAKKVKKKDEPQPTASKAKPVEKKKKGDDDNLNRQGDGKRKSDVITVKNIGDRISRITYGTQLLQETTLCPFKWINNKYFCLYCNEEYNDTADLREHNNTQHYNMKAFDVASKLTKLKTHDVVKVDVTDTRCKICEHVAPNLDALKAHLVNEHEKNAELLTCDAIQPFKFTPGNYTCALCVDKFDDFKSLNQHMNYHYQKYICEDCGIGFMTPDRLKSHGKTHLNGEFPCEKCQKTFKSKTARWEHSASVHKKVKRHRCPHCPESFINYYQRNKHVSTVHGVQIKEFKCTMCPKVFTVSGKLGTHINNIHLKIKRFSCDMCEFKCYMKSDLKDHMVKHTGERNFQCGVCKKSYGRSYTLKEHLRIHADDRRFSCTVCPMAFVQKCSLKNHLRVNHPDAYKDYVINEQN